MQLSITGRRVEIPETLEILLRSKVQKLERFGHKLTAAHAIFGKEKYLYTAELTLSAKGLRIVGKGKHPHDILTSMEEALAHLETQIKRREQKQAVEKRRRVPRRPA